MKLYKKNELAFKNGYLVDTENNVVPMDGIVVAQLNKLETTIQQAHYWGKQPQPECVTPRSLDGFERESAFGVMPEVKLHTPLLDAKIEESMKLVNEIKGTEVADIINDAIKEYKELIDWVEADEMVEGGCTSRVDTPTIGNPLELNAKKVVSIIAQITGIMNDAAVCQLESMLGEEENYEVVEPDDAARAFIDALLSTIGEDCDNCDDTDCPIHPDNKDSDDKQE